MSPTTSSSSTTAAALTKTLKHNKKKNLPRSLAITVFNAQIPLQAVRTKRKTTTETASLAHIYTAAVIRLILYVKHISPKRNHYHITTLMVKISKPMTIIIPNNWYVAATGILGRPRTRWKHYISWLAWECSPRQAGGSGHEEGCLG